MYIYVWYCIIIFIKQKDRFLLTFESTEKVLVLSLLLYIADLEKKKRKKNHYRHNKCNLTLFVPLARATTPSLLFIAAIYGLLFCPSFGHDAPNSLFFVAILKHEHAVQSSTFSFFLYLAHCTCSIPSALFQYTHFATNKSHFHLENLADDCV